MQLAEIKTGTKIEMEVFDENGEKITPNFASQFEVAVDDKTAIIAAPIYEGNVYPIRLNWYFNGFFYAKDDIYRFKAKIAGRGSNEGIAHLRIELAGEIVKVQRREFFRFDCSVPVRYKVLGFGDDQDKADDYKKGVTRDLSGGGLCIKLEEKVELGKVVDCELQLGDKKVNFKGKVVRSSVREKDHKYGFEIGVIFKNIEYSAKEAIIRYIFSEQRRLRKKGLI